MNTFFNLKVCLVLFGLITIILYPPFIQAQTDSEEIVSTYQISDSNAVNGDILLSSENGLIRANVIGSNKIFGILQLFPLAVFKSINDPNKPVARSGVSEVNVSSINGDINHGDFITSSPIAGKGQKATVSGYVIGIALENFNESNGQKQIINSQEVTVGQIKVAIRPEFAEINTSRSMNRLFEQINIALLKNVQDPEQFAQIVRYILAGFIIITALAIGFFTFSRSLIKSVEAIGRNPLAKNSIQFTLIVNTVLIIIIALIGTIAAFFILRL